MSTPTSKYYGYIEFAKDTKNQSVNVYDSPVNDAKFFRYNMTLKDYNPEIYEFRVDVNYTYVIPSTILRFNDPIYKQQDVVVDIKIYAHNKETNQNIGFLEAKRMYYNIQNADLNNPLYAISLLSADYTILVNQKGIFENIANLETKLPPGVIPPVYWELFFYEKEYPIPNVSGKWLCNTKSLPVPTQQVPPTFNYINNEGILEIEQDPENPTFLLVTYINANNTNQGGYTSGILEKVTASDGAIEWKIIIPSFQNNGFVTHYISSIDDENNVNEFRAYGIQSGYNCCVQSQIPLVAESICTKLLDEVVNKA